MAVFGATPGLDLESRDPRPSIVNSALSCADLLCVLLADRVATFMRRSRSASHLVQRLGGTILVALGLNLAFSRH
ncbi:hypothetical protein [Jiella pacifica]|uniref:LysE type translocator n=1 Tax=Jiella pacifica TaxID=2696469 RepID=A0A6N9TDU4_9HYPH|nr:hypothetical protein [Jiella pacifica]NDW07038.1 hypothetical protein [Jiella pacifica]